MGHPLHPFDLHRLDGKAIVVRRAAEGERLETLDGIERVLTADDLLIADRAKGVAIAGVMGSAAAEVAGDTADVLLESAFFERTGILWTSRRLGLSTEASARFERGADPEAVAPAAARAARLIAEWAGGRVLGGACDAGTVPDRRRVVVRPSRTSFALALPVTAGEIEHAFGRLGIEATQTGPDTVEVDVPGYRVDLTIEEDLIEEVARLYGYMRLPSTMPAVRQTGGFAETYAFRRRVRDALLRAGVRETTSIPFASAAEVELAGLDPGEDVLRVMNPVDADRAFLRPSLVPGLVRALGVNLARQVRGAVLFEVGHVFRGSSEVEEDEHVAAALTGPAWAGYPYPQRDLDFFDAKGVLEALLASLGIDRWSLGGPASWPYHPGRSATIVVAGEDAGSLGELHPGAAERADLPDRVTVLELAMAVLARHATTRTSAADVPRLPPARRDLAFLVDQAVPAGSVQEAVLAAAGGLADSAVLFDVFEGEPLPDGKKNLAFAVEFRAADRTLTDEEVDRAVAAIEARIRSDFGGELRAG
jgi:phenylalanyl-tRNA synthetase beta chain